MAEVTSLKIDEMTAASGFAGTLTSHIFKVNGPTGDTFTYWDPVGEVWAEYPIAYARGFTPKLTYQWGGVKVELAFRAEYTWAEEMPEYPLLTDWLSTTVWYLDLAVSLGTSVVWTESQVIRTVDSTRQEQWAVGDDAVDVSIQLGGGFERWADYTLTAPSGGTRAYAWGYYPESYSPAGMPSPELEYYYVPKTEGIRVQVTASYQGTQKIDFDTTYSPTQLGYADAAAYREAFRELPGFTFTASPEANPYLNGSTANNTPFEILDGALLGDTGSFEFALACQALTGSSQYGEGRHTFVASGRALTFATTGVWVADGSPYVYNSSAILQSTSGGADVTYSGSVAHADGEAVSGAHIVFRDDTSDSNTDPLTAVSGEEGTFTATRHYLGSWTAQLNGGGQGDSEAESDVFDVHGALRMDNCAGLGEPLFPFEGMIGSNWAGYADSAMMHAEHSGAFSWANAVTFSAPQTKRVADLTQAAAQTGWALSVTPAGAASMTADASGIHVTVGAGATSCKLAKTFAGGSWAGGRRVEIGHTSDDSGALAFKAAGSEWSFSAASPRIDVLKPTNRSGAGHVDSCLGVGEWPWHWGINAPGTVEISGLRAGKTYHFTHLDLVRLTEAEGGQVEVHIYPGGGFVGDAPQSSRTSDLKQRLESTSTVGNVTTSVYRCQDGMVFVDGCVAAELTLVDRAEVSSPTTAYWIIVGVALSSSRLTYPSRGSGLLSVSVNAGANAWRVGDTSGAWLVGGRYSGYGSVSVGATLYAARSIIPPCWGDVTFQLTKTLRGRALVRIIDEGQSSQPVQVRLQKKWGEKLIGDAISATADSSGILRSSALQQPTCEVWTITSRTATTLSVTGIKRAASDYVGLSIYCLGPSGPTYHQFTINSISSGLVVLSGSMGADLPEVGSSAYVLLPVSWRVEATTSTGTVGADISMRNHTAQYLLIKGLFEQSGAIVDLHADHNTGVMQVAANRVGALSVARSLDNGTSWSAPVAVASGAEGAPCLVRSVRHLGIQGVAWAGVDGVGRVAWSDNLFATMEVRQLITGVKHVRCRLCDLTGIMLVAGWRISDGQIVVSRSLDHGATTTNPVAVAAAPDQAFGLDLAGDNQRTWLITCADSGGNVHIYGSNDAGTSWRTIS